MKPTPSALDLRIEDVRWRRIPRLKYHLELAAATALDSLPKNYRFPCRINLLLSTNAVIRKLNRDFRGLDKPTNVLSFPQFNQLKSVRFDPEMGPVHMGDIAISYQYVVAEAKKTHKILINHLTHLMIHGILHLFGYDHGVEVDANRMERLEKRIMKQLGLPDPYAVLLHNPKQIRPK